MAKRNGPAKVKKYSLEFKLKAVQLSSQPGVLMKDVAESLCIHPFMLSRWRKQVRDGELTGDPPEIEPPLLAALDIVEYRPPDQSDFPALRALLSSNGWEHRLGDEAWFAALLAASRALVAVEGSEIVGFARAVTDGLSNGYLSMVVVSPGFRNRGIGTRLVRELLGANPGVTWVLRASRPGARAFFEKLGFRPSSDAMEIRREGDFDG